jgi:hypothetical protein
MTVVFSIILVTGVGLFVAWPFVRPAATASDSDGDAITPLERQKLDAYAALREAEFDWRMGKLSDTDYGALREQYRRQALGAIAAIEESRGRAKRERKAASARPARRVAFCPSCGEKVQPRANFCGRCGQSLRELVA